MKKIITLLAVAFCLNTNAQIITTVAGNGYTASNSSQTAGTATASCLSFPLDVAVDAAGNLYISDGQGLTQKVNTGGIMSLIAGTVGAMGYSGDGGQATAAQLSNPDGLAIDAANNIYIATQTDNRIRKINSSGIITTVVGTGMVGYSGDGGQATAAQLNSPVDVAIDVVGNLYVAGQFYIRKVNTAGIISTVAGNNGSGYSGDGGQATAAKFNGISSIALDSSGNIYIADQNNYRIRKINIAGIVNTIAGNGTSGYTGDGGQATAAEFGYINGITLDKNGNVYFSDENAVVRRVNTTGIINTIAGNGTSGFSGDGGQATAAELDKPFGITFDAVGNLYIADYQAQRIRKVNMCAIPTVSYTLSQNATPQTWDAYPSYSSNITSAKWYWGDGSSTTGFYPSHTYSVAGKYNICVTAYNLCGDSVSYCQNDSVYRYSNNSTLSNMVYVNVLQNTTGIKNISSKNDVNIYPNPAQTNFTIETTASEKQTMQLFDVNGKLILLQTIIGKTIVDVSNLNAGVYNLNLISNDGVVNKRVVVVK